MTMNRPNKTTYYERTNECIMLFNDRTCLMRRIVTLVIDCHSVNFTHYSPAPFPSMTMDARTLLNTQMHVFDARGQHVLVPFPRRLSRRLIGGAASHETRKLPNLNFCANFFINTSTNSSSASIVHSRMAAKPEEVDVVTVDSVSEPAAKQPETAAAPEKAEEKKVQEPPTAEMKNLNVSEKETEGATAAVAIASAPIAASTSPSTSSQKPTPASGEPIWPETPADHPLSQFYNTFEELVKEASHSEVYGITLSKTSPFHTKLILQKFLRANANDLAKAKEQLLETLKWRKEFDPVKAAQETFARERFEGLGWILQVEGVPESVNKKDVVTFNVYGKVKDNRKTFGDLER